MPTNTVYSGREFYGLTLSDLPRAPWRSEEMLRMLRARRSDYCEQEIERARSGGPPGAVIVLLSDRPPTEEMAPGVICSPLSWARYCVRS